MLLCACMYVYDLLYFTGYKSHLCKSHHGFEQHYHVISHNELFDAYVATHILPVIFRHQSCDLYPVNFSTFIYGIFIAAV